MLDGDYENNLGNRGWWFGRDGCSGVGKEWLVFEYNLKGKLIGFVEKWDV